MTTHKQCKKCPWLVTTDPYDIPDGYCEEAHRGLEKTIARDLMPVFNAGFPAMACHESPVGKERMCVGWMHNQLGVGNNIALRLWASKHLTEPLKLIGEQHERFEDTLPEGY